MPARSVPLAAAIALALTVGMTVGMTGAMTGAPAVARSTPAAPLSLDAVVGGPFAPSSVGLEASAHRSAIASAAASPISVLDRGKKRSREWAFPVRPDTPVSGRFGEIGPYWPTGHAGIDFDGDLGDPVFAVLPGRVITAEFNHGGYGNLIVIRRGDGTEVRYAHLHRMLVEVGDRVHAGVRIGRMGTTGQSTGVHLHLEVRVNNGRTPTNPASVWSGKRPGVPAPPPAWSCAKYGGCVS